MADEILNCDGTDPIHVPDWNAIVGDGTLENGGYAGDMLSLARVHLEDAKDRGELREEDAGVAYGSAIMESMKSAITFELGFPKSQLEMCFLSAQIDKINADIENDACKAAAECALKGAQQAQVEYETSDILPANKAKTTEETLLVTEKIESEDKNNETDGLIDAQIDKMIADVAIAEEEILIKKAQADKEYAEMLATIDKEYGMYYELDPNGDIIRSSIVDDGGGKLDAEVVLVNKEGELKTQQILTETENTELIREKTESEEKQNEIDGLIDHQIEKIGSDISLSESKLALEQANAIAQIDKVMGYDYTLDGDGNIIVGEDTFDGKLDAEKDLMFAEKDLKVDELLTSEQERDELILKRKLDLLKTRLSVFDSLYRNKNIDNIPTIVDGSHEDTIDELYVEVLNGTIT